MTTNRITPEPTRDALIAFFTLDILATPLPALRDSILATTLDNPTDDATIDDDMLAAFAELDIIDERDAAESLLDIFSDSTATTDDALDDDMRPILLAIDEHFDAIHAAIIAICRRRLDRNY